MKSIATLFLLICLCNVNAKKPFAENKETIKNLENLFVFTDALILDDFGQNIRGLDVEHNYEVNDKLYNYIKYYLSDTLKAKVTHAHSSVGMNQEGFVYAIDTYNKNNKINLPLSKASEFTKIQNSQVERVFETMDYTAKSRKANKEYQQKYQTHQPLDLSNLELKKNEAALFFLIEGAKVPDKKKGQKTALSLLLSLGNAFVIELSVYRTYLLIIDNEGKVLWASIAGKPGNILEEDDLTSTMWRSFKKFPVRIKNRTVR
ncbi:MAG: hypothetical protein R3E90_13630 [Marinicella sp.]|nr:hypothetical protein [Xanthomonadales bacterium]